MERRSFLGALACFTAVLVINPISILPRTYDAKFWARKEDDFGNNFVAAIEISGHGEKWRNGVIIRGNWDGRNENELRDFAKELLVDSAKQHLKISEIDLKWVS